jgi:O-succinylbenzoic acid--CoA ligase
VNIEPALKALAAALHGEGPAVELSAGPNGEPVVSLVETPGIEDAAVVVRTSGSTGTPKATVLTVDALAASSMATAFALKGEGQWLLALPLQYVAGIQVLVRSLFAGTRPWAMDLSNGFTTEGFTAAALELTDKIRFTSLVPAQLKRLLDAPSADTLAVLRRFNGILLGGGPVSQALLESARDAGLRVVTTYGAAETAGGCVYDGFPLEGVAVRVAEVGRIHLGGATLAAGYLDAPRLTAEAFSDDDGIRWYRTNDLGTLDADGRLTVLGRADDVIITGGVKISALHVQEELEKFDGVTAAFVAGVDSATWGQAVAAYVAVPDGALNGVSLDGVSVDGSSGVSSLPASGTDPGAALGAALAEQWHRTLGLLAPKTVLPASELITLPNGKPDRLAMIERLNALHQGK